MSIRYRRRAKGTFLCIMTLLAICGAMLPVLASEKEELTDEEMSGVLGGCGPCDWATTYGCTKESEHPCDERGTSDCSDNQGYYTTDDCETQNKRCKRQTTASCTDRAYDCTGTYTLGHCQVIDGVCQENRSSTQNCGGQYYLCE